MRVGINPSKTNTELKFKFTHQVIIPVFIPNKDGYFKDSLPIFKLCIQSLIKTCHQQTYISIINNGSCKDVVKYLDDLFLEKKIQEIIHTSNIGKINSILKGLVGINTSLVTISDQDILFQNGWQSETINIFNNCPKAGVVGLIPMVDLHRNNSENCIFDYLFSNKMKFDNISDLKNMKMFYDSIWGFQKYDENFFKKVLFLALPNQVSAYVGSGHLVATYKRSIFSSLPSTLSKELLSSQSEKKFLDLPPSKFGYYRLTTAINCAYHMGNSFEEWMIDFSPTIQKNALKIILYKNGNNSNFRFFKMLGYLSKRYFVKRIIFIPIFYKLFLFIKSIDE